MVGWTRGGSDVRQFCGYYVLELLRAGERLSRRDLLRTIAERSAENRAFRRSGVLRVPARDMDQVLVELEERRWIQAVGLRGKRGGPVVGRKAGLATARWRLTRRGRKARKQMVEEAAERPGGKQRAARKLMGLVGKSKRPGWALDVGTGEGFLAFRLARRGFGVLGVDSGEFDYSKESIQKARQRTRSAGGRVAFCQADIVRVPEGVCGRRLPRHFALVTASQAIHCMRDQHRCSQAVFALLKPRGRFLALDFAVGVKGFLAHGFHCFLAPTRGEWVELLSSVGFCDLSFHDAGDYLVVEARKPARHSELPVTAMT